MRTRLLLLAMSCVSLFAQESTSPPPALKEPTITLVFDNPELPVPHYTLSLGADGEARYVLPPRVDAPAGLVTTLHLSKISREKAFALAANLNHLTGNFDFTKHRVAFTGWRTFTYKSGATANTTRFNWSENPSANELAALFEGIAATIEAENQLRYLRKYDKLGLNSYLGNLEKKAKSGWVKELPILSNVLNELAQDPEVMNIARQRAQRLAQAAAVQ
jgi:hypothetical protein